MEENEIKVSASILCADFTKLGEEIRSCEQAGSDMIHIDVMDGHFVPNISIGMVIIESIRPLTKLPLDVHLMIEHPGMYIDQFIDAGADIISIHAECYGQLKKGCRGVGQFPKEIETFDKDEAQKDITRIKNRGKKVFLALNPGTTLCFSDLLSDLDGVLMMSVNPGFAKQKFMPEILLKVKELRKFFLKDISIDGGINKETALTAVKAGVSILVTASCFFNSSSRQEVVSYLKSLE